MPQRKFAIVTGASSGIGLELARCAARDGYDLLVAADEPLVDASAGLKNLGVEVWPVEADLATAEGVGRLIEAIGSREVDVLVANAGHGLGGAFLDQDPRAWRHVIDTNVTGTVLLIQLIARRMVARGSGRILITGSIAGHIAGSFQAVYNGTKAFIDSFSDALGNELKEPRSPSPASSRARPTPPFSSGPICSTRKSAPVRRTIPPRSRRQDGTQCWRESAVSSMV